MSDLSSPPPSLAVLGVAEPLQQLGDEAAGVSADAAAPMDQPLGRPLLVRTMRGRHVFVQRGEAAAPRAAGMAGHALASVQHLHQRVGDVRLQLQPDQRVRHAVAVGLDLDVVAGEVLREEYLLPLGLSVNALSMALGVSATRIHEILKERRGVSADTAERLSRHFGGDVASWLALQADHDAGDPQGRRAQGSAAGACVCVAGTGRLRRRQRPLAKTGAARLTAGASRRPALRATRPASCRCIPARRRRSAALRRACTRRRRR